MTNLYQYIIDQIFRFPLMNNVISICTYHKIIDKSTSKYPKLKGIEEEDFKNQLDFLKKYYNIISLSELIFYISEKKKLPIKSLLITFDDGYLEHYKFAYSELLKRNISGTFFIPGKVIFEKKALDVNKIHIILAKCGNLKIIIDKIYYYINKYRSKYNFPENEIFFDRTLKNSIKRFDEPEIIFIKQCLQRLLPKELRTKIINELLMDILNLNEEILSSELYLNKNQLLEMLGNNMFVGSHGYEHNWLNSITKDEKELEIEKCIQLLSLLNIPKKLWSICYPYGGYDNEVINICKKNNIHYGFTTKVGIANLNKESLLSLSRLDTNDFPLNPSSNPSKFYYDS